MRVDFYQLSRDPVEKALPLLAAKALERGERVLVVAQDPKRRQALSRALWSFAPESFLANGEAGAGNEDRQPILLSDTPEPANGARFMMIADGQWCESNAGFERIFYMFDGETVEQARQVWRDLRSGGGERHYWAQEDGRWVNKASA